MVSRMADLPVPRPPIRRLIRFLHKTLGSYIKYVLYVMYIFW